MPVEVVKQRRQAGEVTSSLAVANQAWKSHGLQGLYRGGLATLAREVPFSLVQFPLWELLKAEVVEHKGRPTTPAESAVCGSLGGVVAGALTTPLDVVKTRMMLNTGHQEKASSVLFKVVKRNFKCGYLSYVYVLQTTLLNGTATDVSFCVCPGKGGRISSPPGWIDS